MTSFEVAQPRPFGVPQHPHSGARGTGWGMPQALVSVSQAALSFGIDFRAGDIHFGADGNRKRILRESHGNLKEPFWEDLKGT
jgi:hypothetical protein